MDAAGYYPYQASIDAYGNGGFRFAEMSHKGSLLCLPTGMQAWAVTDSGEIDLDSLKPVFDAADELDVLLIGLGATGAQLPRDVREALRASAIIAEATDTGGAIRTYNILLGERRAVGAALIAVDRVRKP
ncbi:MAG: Mth938-like domain-containing protein [Hyphomicrobiaceae bacterium]|nr:Mth938-like domain-containing protein [Hyphomicrobiaceae bacterium]